MLLGSPDKWFLHFYVVFILKWIEKWQKEACRNEIQNMDLPWAFSSYRKKWKSKEYCLFFLQSQKVKKNCYRAWLPTICFQLSRHILEGGNWLNFSVAHLTAAPTTLHARQVEGRHGQGGRSTWYGGSEPKVSTLRTWIQNSTRYSTSVCPFVLPSRERRVVRTYLTVQGRGTEPQEAHLTVVLL